MRWLSSKARFWTYTIHVYLNEIPMTCWRSVLYLSNCTFCRKWHNVAMNRKSNQSTFSDLIFLVFTMDSNANFVIIFHSVLSHFNRYKRIDSSSMYFLSRCLFKWKWDHRIVITMFSGWFGFCSIFIFN